jgi:hypothetical protein
LDEDVLFGIGFSSGRSNDSARRAPESIAPSGLFQCGGFAPFTLSNSLETVIHIPQKENPVAQFLKAGDVQDR